MSRTLTAESFAALSAHNTSGVNGLRLRRKAGRIIVCAHWRDPKIGDLHVRELSVDLVRPTDAIRDAMAAREGALGFKYPFTALFAWRQLSRRIPD